MKWNEKLKQARKDAKLTQHELADYLGVSRSTVANYELGRRKPNFIELKKIASRLSVDVNFLVEGDEVSAEQELLSRATHVFNDVTITNQDKDLIFQDIMELYLKGKSNDEKSDDRKRYKN